MNEELSSIWLAALYTPIIPPVADNEELASKGRRIMLEHRPRSGVFLFLAEKGVVNVGWVIGLKNDLSRSLPKPIPMHHPSMDAPRERKPIWIQ